MAASTSARDSIAAGFAIPGATFDPTNAAALAAAAEGAGWADVVVSAFDPTNAAALADAAEDAVVFLSVSSAAVLSVFFAAFLSESKIPIFLSLIFYRSIFFIRQRRLIPNEKNCINTYTIKGDARRLYF
jgi:hypothetical protein